ncbi:MAG: hypothetical protein ABSD28_11335 [Tepidisphaeraceae bacterium]
MVSPTPPWPIDNNGGSVSALDPVTGDIIVAYAAMPTSAYYYGASDSDIVVAAYKYQQGTLALDTSFGGANCNTDDETDPIPGYSVVNLQNVVGIDPYGGAGPTYIATDPNNGDITIEIAKADGNANFAEMNAGGQLVSNFGSYYAESDGADFGGNGVEMVPMLTPSYSLNSNPSNVEVNNEPWFMGGGPIAINPANHDILLAGAFNYPNLPNFVGDPNGTETVFAFDASTGALDTAWGNDGEFSILDTDDVGGTAKWGAFTAIAATSKAIYLGASASPLTPSYDSYPAIIAINANGVGYYSGFDPVTGGVDTISSVPPELQSGDSPGDINAICALPNGNIEFLESAGASDFWVSQITANGASTTRGPNGDGNVAGSWTADGGSALDYANIAVNPTNGDLVVLDGLVPYPQYTNLNGGTISGCWISGTTGNGVDLVNPFNSGISEGGAAFDSLGNAVLAGAQNSANPVNLTLQVFGPGGGGPAGGLTLLSASSIRNQGGTSYAINLPLNVPNGTLPGIEDRDSRGSMKDEIALDFSVPISSSGVTVTLTNTNNGADGLLSSVSVNPGYPEELDVYFTNPVNGQTLVLTANNVTELGTNITGNFTVKCGFLLGDIAGEASVGQDSVNDFWAWTDGGNYTPDWVNNYVFRADFFLLGYVNGNDYYNVLQYQIGQTLTY